MTNEKAIEELKAIKSEYNNKAFGDSRLMRSEIEALDMAIQALESIPKYKDAYNKGWDDGAKATYEHLKMCEEEQGGDLISRDAVRKVISVLYGRELCEITYQINLLPSVNPQEPKWIPVSERLPDKNVWVLVTVVQGSGWYIETMRIDKYKGMFTDNIDYYDSVIAWMPLPEPYKAESNHKCHTCKHYMSGEYDGSCDSYICEHYSGWESEDKG